MSEPKAIAERAERVAPALLHWTVDDDRIGSRSDSWAIDSGGDLVLVDPLPLAEDALAALGTVRMVVVTIQSHQRSAWRLRRRLAVPVFAPLRAAGLEEEPDHCGADGSAPLSFVPSEYQDEPARTRESVRRLLSLDAPIVCSGHGAPVLSDGVDEMRRALSQDAGG